MVLFNGMEKTSHWAALYFVALMTFGNYVLFNLLVAILVEGFSSEVEFCQQKSPRPLLPPHPLTIKIKNEFRKRKKND